MNIDRKVLVLASFPAIMLGGCNFNEDFCIREGELVAWCDFSGIKEKPPVPQERHVIPFGTDVPYSEGTTFTQDTLRWSLPQGAYRFLFYTGNYELLDRNDYHETRLSVRTDTIDGEAHLSEVQKFCCSSAFSERHGVAPPGGGAVAHGHRTVVRLELYPFGNLYGQVSGLP